FRRGCTVLSLGALRLSSTCMAAAGRSVISSRTTGCAGGSRTAPAPRSSRSATGSRPRDPGRPPFAAPPPPPAGEAPGAVAVAGDSAGGTLAALACLRLRDEYPAALPRLQALLCANPDLTGD